ncbi:hypothetical protein EHS25_008632 [Saitozyma podzolica]|uniref:K Homology domain-containing protein n=1 Tax=Saitozyma podzolica TaxID=1890683 RepID=A0A427YMD1_9TREE|nr:hypothetical protein EHS25_008632 [Saitozyma podzolica]
MDPERKSRWGEPSSSSDATKTEEEISAAATQAAAIAAKIAASLRPGVVGNELVRREQDEGFVKDIEVNDLRNRYVLTKASTQKQIQEETGASVQTKGTWVPDRAKIQPGEIPLYLHIVATSQIVLDAAVAKVNELINSELGPLIDDRTLIARNRAMGLPPPQHLDQRGRPKWPEAKLPIGLDSLRNFNVRAKTVGPGDAERSSLFATGERRLRIKEAAACGGGRYGDEEGAASREMRQRRSWWKDQADRDKGMFVKYIQAETGARVQIKGIGSGFLESDTGREAEEPLHINIAAPNEDQVERAKVLAEDLLSVLRLEYAKARDGTHNGGHAGVYQPGYGTYAPQQQQQQQQQPAGQDAYAAYYGQQAQGAQGTPDASQAAGGATPAAGGMPQQGTEAWQQYAAYWAAYGYDVNDPQFQAWQASQYGQQQAGQPAA